MTSSWKWVIMVFHWLNSFSDWFLRFFFSHDYIVVLWLARSCIHPGLCSKQLPDMVQYFWHKLLQFSLKHVNCLTGVQIPYHKLSICHKQVRCKDRTCLICSISTFCYLLSCWYTATTPPLRHGTQQENSFNLSNFTQFTNKLYMLSPLNHKLTSFLTPLNSWINWCQMVYYIPRPTKVDSMLIFFFKKQYKEQIKTVFYFIIYNLIAL